MSEETITRAIGQKRIDSLEGVLKDIPKEQQRTCMRFFLNGLGFYSSSDLAEMGITLTKQEQRVYYDLQASHLREVLEDPILRNYVLRKLEDLGMEQEEGRIRKDLKAYLEEVRRMMSDS